MQVHFIAEDYKQRMLRFISAAEDFKKNHIPCLFGFPDGRETVAPAHALSQSNNFHCIPWFLSLHV